MTKNNLYIDCQVFQTPAWDRGMGRYVRSLLQSLYPLSKQTSYRLIFSTNLPQNDDAIAAATAICPGAEIVTLDLWTTRKSTYKTAAAHNKTLLDEYIAAHPSEGRTLFMIPCLFQEPTASVFPTGVETSLLYYDAIPLLYFHRYLNAINYDNYLERHKTLFAADKIFTISQTIADDLAVYYGMSYDQKHVVNIDGACIEGMFADFKKPALELPEKYILLPTSDDIRKNNRAALQAFNQLRTLTGKDYKLVVTSKFDEARQKALATLAKNVIFTGNVNDAELAWLYKNAEVVLFTSEYEGLGLPVLEAVKMGKKVVCSNIPVFREISEEAFYLFDPLDIGDITHKLYQGLRGDDWHDKQKLYKAINQKYTWQRSAKIMHDALGEEPAPKNTAPKPKLAVIAPVPDGYSAVGKVIQELHFATSQHFDVHYYFENRKEKPPVHVRPNYLKHLTPCFDAEAFNAKTYRNYDAVIYHVGNSEYCFYSIIDALHLPGIAIVHDTVLSDAFGEMVRLGYMLPQRLEAEAQLDALTGTKQTGFITSLVNNQIATVVHSDYARKAITPLLEDGGQVVRAELPSAVPIQNVQSQQREVVHVGLAGVLGGRKGLDIIKNLAEDKALADNVIFHVFGFSFVDPKATEELEGYKNVRLSTDLTDLEYQTQLLNLDILVNYRSHYRGETSLTVLEAMRYGCVSVVNADLGWFAELPDDAVVKVATPDDIQREIVRLVGSPHDRKRIGTAAKDYVAAHHSPDAYVQLLSRLAMQYNDSPNGKHAAIVRASHNAQQVIDQYNAEEQ